jgi:Holliday junction resolvase RusA-like endonuclease
VVNTIIFDSFIQLEPVTWKRQGATGKFRWRDVKQMRAAKDNLGWEIKAAAPGLRCDSTARFGYRMSFYLRHRSDHDNLIKLVMDALQGIVWENDEQVDEGTWLKKNAAGQPGIMLTIYRIEP